MKKSFLFAAFVLCLAASPLKAWIQRDTIGGGPRSAASGFAIGTAAYVAVGLDSNSYKRSMWMYNPATDIWTQMQSLGNATGQGLERDIAMAFAIGNKAYIVGGQGSNPYFSDTWEWDAVTNTWSQKQAFNGGGRRAGVAFAINGKGYVGLGQALTGLKNDLWEYNPTTNLWTAKTNFPGTARRLAACFVINNVAYVGTGDDGAFKADMFAYDPITNTWTPKAAFAGTPRYSTISFALYNKGYVGLGYDNTLQNTDDIWEYDPFANAWIFKDNFPGSKRANATAVVTPNNKCYVGLGYDSLLREDWWEFDPTIDGISEEDYLALKLAVFPNPSNDNITVGITEEFYSSGAQATLTLSDITGKIVLVHEVTSLGNVVLETASYPSGVYMLTLQIAKGRRVTKRVVLN